jgi:hypothetical protein
LIQIEVGTISCFNNNYNVREITGEAFLQIVTLGRKGIVLRAMFSGLIGFSGPPQPDLAHPPRAFKKKRAWLSPGSSLLVTQLLKFFLRQLDLELLSPAGFDLSFFPELRLVPSDTSHRCLTSVKVLLDELENLSVRLRRVENHVRNELSDVHLYLSSTDCSIKMIVYQVSKDIMYYKKKKVHHYYISLHLKHSVTKGGGGA